APLVAAAAAAGVVLRVADGIVRIGLRVAPGEDLRGRRRGGIDVLIGVAAGKSERREYDDRAEPTRRRRRVRQSSSRLARENGHIPSFRARGPLGQPRRVKTSITISARDLFSRPALRSSKKEIGRMTAPGARRKARESGASAMARRRSRSAALSGLDRFDALGRRRRRLEAVLSPSMTRRTSGRAAASTIGYQPFRLVKIESMRPESTFS